MKTRDLSFKGHYQDQDQTVAEQIQIVVPESDVDEQLLSWSILPHAETVADDESRRDYNFHYEVLGYLGNGLYKLRLTCQDASRNPHSAEIVAAMGVAAGTGEQGRAVDFEPYWFIDDHLHFRSDQNYGGPAYGRLRFGDPSELPQRRLFGMTMRS